MIVGNLSILALFDPIIETHSPMFGGTVHEAELVRFLTEEVIYYSVKASKNRKQRESEANTFDALEALVVDSETDGKNLKLQTICR